MGFVLQLSHIHPPHYFWAYEPVKNKVLVLRNQRQQPQHFGVGAVWFYGYMWGDLVGGIPYMGVCDSAVEEY